MKRRIYNDASESWGVEFQDAVTSTMNGRIGLYNSVMYYSFIILIGVVWALISAWCGEEKIIIEGVEVHMAGFKMLMLNPRPKGGLGKLMKRIVLVFKGILSKNFPCLLVGMVNMLGAVYLLVSLGLGGVFYFKLIVAFIVGSMVMFRGYALGYTLNRAMLQNIWSLLYLKGSMLVLGLFIREGVGHLLLKIPNFYLVWGVVLGFGVASIVISEVGVLRGIREKVEEEIGITITFSILVVISFSKNIAPSIEEGNIDNELMAKVVLLYSLGVLLIRLGRIMEIIESRNVEIYDLSRVTRDLVLITIVLLLLLNMGIGDAACWVVEGEGPKKGDFGLKVGKVGTTDSLPPGPTDALEGAIADSLEGPIRDGLSKG